MGVTGTHPTSPDAGPACSQHPQARSRVQLSGPLEQLKAWDGNEGAGTRIRVSRYSYGRSSAVSPRMRKSGTRIRVQRGPGGGYLLDMRSKLDPISLDPDEVAGADRCPRCLGPTATDSARTNMHRTSSPERCCPQCGDTGPEGLCPAPRHRRS